MIPGLPQHVTRRGNNRQDVFFVEGDRRAYLGPLAVTSWRARWSPATWRELLCEPDDDVAGRLRLSTSRGRPLTTDSFVSKLERLPARRLRPLPVGSPKKNRSKAGKPRKQ